VTFRSARQKEAGMAPFKFLPKAVAQSSACKTRHAQANNPSIASTSWPQAEIAKIDKKLTAPWSRLQVSIKERLRGIISLQFPGF
jgi:hypothetical protein